MLFVLGIFAAPVSAHYTLGDLTGSAGGPPFRNNDFDYRPAHVPGVIAYVWPAGGPFSTPPGWTPYPGYQPPYPGSGWAAAPAPPWRTDWYQLESTYYAPFGAILTSTIKEGTAFNKMKVSGNPTIETAGTWVDGASIPIEHANKGDLIIAFNATKDFSKTFTAVHIDIPPEITGLSRKKVTCSWTNNYDLFEVDKEVMENLHAPLWNYITIYADPEFPITFSTTGEWYYVRINDVTAPTIAGRYFFKVFMSDSPPGSPELYASIYDCPVQNWPVLLVKGEVDPGIITGTIRYGGWVPTLYCTPAMLPGRVRAVGIADDPYTFKSTGRPVEARAYFNHTANGHYEIEGVAPGTYDVYASLAGYPEIKIASGVKVLKGQSAHIDGHVSPGVVIHGEVFSKCGTGEVLWRCSPRADWNVNLGVNVWGQASNQKIKIEIYRSLDDALATKPATSSTKAISWSPANQKETAARQFAWPGYPTPDGDPAWPSGAAGYDPDGVGPRQTWAVLAARSSFRFQFGHKGLYGAPAEWTGHIPQAFATWTDGIPAGTFHIRAWTHGYVQTQPDGVTFAPVTFTVASVEWAGDVFVPFDLMLSSYIVKEFHFHDQPGTLQDNGWLLPDRDRKEVYLYVDVKDAAGTRHGWAVRSFAPAALSGTAYKAVGVRGLLGRSVYQRSYGFLAGTYIAKGYAAGYVDQRPTTVSIGLCGSDIRFSDHLDKGAQFKIAIYSIDWEHPSVLKYWTWDDENMYVQPYDAAGKPLCPAASLYDKDALTKLPATQLKDAPLTVPVYWGMPVLKQDKTTNFVSVCYYYGAEARYRVTERPGYYPLAFETGTYSFKVFTYGYVQKKPFTLYAVKGAVADVPIKVVQGANVTFDIVFKRESIIDHLRYDSAVRVRIFNDKDVLVGEALTSDYTKYYANAPQPDPGNAAWPSETAVENPAQLHPLSKAVLDPTDGRFQPAFKGAAVEFANFIPSSTARLRGLIAGLPDLYRGGWDPFQAKELINAFNNFSPDIYFDMDWTGTKIPAPYGIDASPNYKGGWYIEVDIVPWYNNKDEPVGTNPAVLTHFTIFYPPVPGVLTGESPKYIPENHFGPYEQRYKVTVPGAHLGGEASVIFQLDLRGLAQGTVYTYTHCGDWRTTSWITVLAVAADGKTYPWYTFDGMYQMWLTPGTYALQVIEWSPAKAEGHMIAKVPSLTVTEGTALSMDFYLEQSGVPIPEFTTAALVLASALAASLFILRRRRKH